MGSTAHVVLGALFVLAAAYATWTMLELFGGQSGAEGKDKATQRHRWAGRVCAVLYLALLVSMLGKVRGMGSLGALPALHAMLALALLPLLAVKVVIARRHKSLHRILPPFGIVILLLATTTYATGLLPGWMRSGSGEAWSTVPPGDIQTSGRHIAEERCSACHDFSRVLDRKGRLDAAGWTATFDRMAARERSLAEVRQPILAWLHAEMAAAPGTGTGGGARITESESESESEAEGDDRGRGRGRGRGGR